MKIIEKRVLADTLGVKITQLKVESPDIAKCAKPGQFVALMASEIGERIPLTIVDKDLKAKTITLIFQEVGLTTKLLGKLNVDGSLYALAGPLGHASEIKKYGKIIVIGGGVGIAEIYPVARAQKEAGNEIITILGARTKDLLILEEELKAVSNEVHICTDDASYGKKGFTTDILRELSTQHAERSMQYELIYAVGPIPMMQKVAEVTKNFSVKTIVSLNALMVDATGMCGCCRVTVAGQTKFSCVDGPEFDANLIDWDELTKRNNIYFDKEKHICKLNKC